MAIAPDRLAQSIVGASLRPTEDETVIISTYPHTVDLAESCALECQKVGADPLIVLDTDTAFYGQFTHYTTNQLRRTSAHCLGLLDYVDSYIWLYGPRDPNPMATVSRERMAAWLEGEKAHQDKALERLPKNVGVGIGQVTRERAKAYGFNLARWRAMVEAAIVVDYGAMGAAGRAVADLLSGPGDVRITGDNGTDLSFRLAGERRKARVNDGVISEEGLAAGTLARRSVHLPAGAVWIAPVEDSAEGRFVSDVPIPQRGRLVEGLAWTFRAGRVTEFTAERNLELAQTNWPEATGEKDRLGALVLGLNEKALPGFLQNPIVSGLVTVAIGDNRWIGGANESSFELLAHLARGSLEIEGETVIEDGRWVV